MSVELQDVVIQDDGEKKKMYQPGILMKAYNSFVTEARKLGVPAKDILFLCVFCVIAT